MLPSFSNITTIRTPININAIAGINCAGEPLLASKVAGRTLFSTKGTTLPCLSTKLSTTNFQGQTLFNEPSIKPPRSANVRVLCFSNIQCSTRENDSKPTTQPNANSASVPNWKDFTALRIGVYIPNNNNMKLLIISLTSLITLITYNIITHGIINYISFNGI